jgi:predicted alpha/beta hydrolase family esterase
MPSKEGYYDPLGKNESELHWIGWLQKQLMVNDIYAAAPEMPLSFHPDYQIWKKEFERYDITPETILVGHSCGAGFLVRWLSERKDTKVSKVVLVAPWINVNHEEDIEFFDGMIIDPELASRAGSFTIFNSTNDGIEMQNSVKKIMAEAHDITYVEFKDYGHFTFGVMKTNEFPELLEEIIA